jgi:hypothetical protein
MGQLVSIPAKIKTKNHQVSEGPLFNESFYKELRLLLEWRLDVRHLCTDPLPDGFVEELVSLASLAPSVGFSQPCRFVRVPDLTFIVPASPARTLSVG